MCEQPPYSILVRGVENDVLPTCQRHGMGVIPWSPLAGGWLSGRYRLGQDLPSSHRAERIPARYDMSLPGNQRKLEAADALAKLAEEAGITLIEMALAFVIRHPAVTAAIIGPRTMEQLESQLGAADVELSDEVLDRIDEIVPPGHQRQSGRRRLAEPGARAVRAAALGPVRAGGGSGRCRRAARNAPLDPCQYLEWGNSCAGRCFCPKAPRTTIEWVDLHVGGPAHRTDPDQPPPR